MTDASVQEGDLESLLTAMFQREANAAKGVLSLVQRDGGGGTKGGVVLFDLMTCLGYSRSALLESSSGLLQSPPPPLRVFDRAAEEGDETAEEGGDREHGELVEQLRSMQTRREKCHPSFRTI